MAGGISGNIEAIRDWTKNYYYDKSEIADKFINHDLIDLSNSDWRSGSLNVLSKNSRYIYAGVNGGYYSVIVPNKNDDVILNPLVASGNHFKISIRFKLLDISQNKWKTLIGNSYDDIGSTINKLPSISINGSTKKINLGISSSSKSSRLSS